MYVHTQSSSKLSPGDLMEFRVVPGPKWVTYICLCMQFISGTPHLSLICTWGRITIPCCMVRATNIHVCTYAYTCICIHTLNLPAVPDKHISAIVIGFCMCVYIYYMYTYIKYIYMHTRNTDIEYSNIRAYTHTWIFLPKLHESFCFITNLNLNIHMYESIHVCMCNMNLPVLLPILTLRGSDNTLSW